MRKRPGTEQIIKTLREFQADLDSGLNINQACRKAGIGITTYYRWKTLQGSRPHPESRCPLNRIFRNPRYSRQFSVFY